ncbi:MAG TPA: hypothetical protein VKZ63_01925 [Kofleriaceae bacterium]|nr:hypothetical protein [Kofleriaceae bacterium]
MSSLRLPLAAALAAALSLAACKKDSLPAGKLTPEVSGLLAQLPADAALVLGINGPAARTSPLFGKVVELWMAAAPELAEAKKVCNLVPAEKIEQLVVTSGADLGQGGLHAAMKGISRKEVADCAAKIGGITVTDDGPVTTYQSEVMTLSARWTAPDVVLVRTAGEDDAQAPPVAASGGATSNQELMAYLKKVDTSAAVWLAGPVPAAMRSQLAGVSSAPRGLFATVDPAGDGLAIFVGLALDSADLAEGTAEQFKDQKEQLAGMMPDPKLGEMLKRVEVLQSGADVAFKVTLSRADIEHLGAMAQGMLGAGLGL